MTTFNLGDGLCVIQYDDHFCIETANFAKLIVTHNKKGPSWDIETQGTWAVTKKDVKQLITALAYVQAAMEN